MYSFIYYMTADQYPPLKTVVVSVQLRILTLEDLTFLRKLKVIHILYKSLDFNSRINYLFTKQLMKIKASDWFPSRMAATEQCASEGLLTPKTTAVSMHILKGLHTHTHATQRPIIGGHNHAKDYNIQ